MISENNPLERFIGLDICGGSGCRPKWREAGRSAERPYCGMFSSSELATVKYVRQIIKDEVFQQLSEYHVNMVKPEFDLMGERIDNLEVKVNYTKDTVIGLKVQLSDTLSRSKFDELKRRVDRYHPTSRYSF